MLSKYLFWTVNRKKHKFRDQNFFHFFLRQISARTFFRFTLSYIWTILYSFLQLFCDSNINNRHWFILFIINAVSCLMIRSQRRLSCCSQYELARSSNPGIQWYCMSNKSCLIMRSNSLYKNGWKTQKKHNWLNSLAYGHAS